MEQAVASYPALADDPDGENTETSADKAGNDDLDPWLNYVISEEDAAALLAMLRRLDNQWA